MTDLDFGHPVDYTGTKRCCIRSLEVWVQAFGKAVIGDRASCSGCLGRMELIEGRFGRPIWRWRYNH